MSDICERLEKLSKVWFCTNPSAQEDIAEAVAEIERLTHEINILKVYARPCDISAAYEYLENEPDEIKRNHHRSQNEQA